MIVHAKIHRAIWISLALVSLGIAGAMNFYAKTFTLLVMTSLFYGAIIFLVLFSYIVLLRFFHERRFGRSLVVFAVFVICLLLLLTHPLNPRTERLCMTVITDLGFQTNLLTGQCEFLGFSGCTPGGYLWEENPWYYRGGCDLSDEEKLGLIEPHVHERMSGECERLCAWQLPEFCEGVFRSRLSCHLFVSCDEITCAE